MNGKLDPTDLRYRFREIKKCLGGPVLGSSYHPQA